MDEHDFRNGAPVDDWSARERYWRKKLGRLRLGAEPLADQLARYRRVTWMLTAVPAGIGIMIVGLFTAFGRPDVGAILAVVLFLPVVSIAWIDFWMLSRRASRYQLERRERTGSTPGRT